MILFVFEGTAREPTIFTTLQKLFFPKNKSHIFCSYGNNIYDLYRKINADIDVDFLSILFENTQNKEFWDYRKNIDEIYLFFDYDGHDNQADDDQIKRMLDFFDNEHENGKLYINYPMVESLLYTKELIDEKFNEYSVSIDCLKKFKETCAKFNFYKNFDFCLLPSNLKSKQKEQQDRLIRKCKENWQKLKVQNVQKANWLDSGFQNTPMNQIHKPLKQNKIFNAQKKLFIDPKKEISVLNAFPQFLFDYFK